MAQGDGEKIGINQPLRITLQLNSIKRAENDNESNKQVFLTNTLNTKILFILSMLLTVGCASQYPDLRRTLRRYTNQQRIIVVSLAHDKTPITSPICLLRKMIL